MPTFTSVQKWLECWVRRVFSQILTGDKGPLVEVLVTPYGITSLTVALSYSEAGHHWVVRDTLPPTLPFAELRARCTTMARLLSESYGLPLTHHDADESCKGI